MITKVMKTVSFNHQQSDYASDWAIAIALLFSGEESYGRYLDLYANHATYCNLKNVGKRPAYLHYIDILLDAQAGMVHSELPKDTRFSKDFETCVDLSI